MSNPATPKRNRVKLVIGREYTEKVGQALEEEIEDRFRGEDRWGGVQPTSGRRRERHFSLNDEVEDDASYEYARNQYENAL